MGAPQTTVPFDQKRVHPPEGSVVDAPTAMIERASPVARGEASKERRRLWLVLDRHARETRQQIGARLNIRLRKGRRKKYPSSRPNHKDRLPVQRLSAHRSGVASITLARPDLGLGARSGEESAPPPPTRKT